MISMQIELWKFPVPVTALLRGPFFRDFPKRRCEISFYIEGNGTESSKVALTFDGVEAYKCTYITSLTAEIINAAYGKLIRIDGSPWIAEISKVYDKGGRASKNLQHLMVCFDDGPCYEFICLQFSANNMS